MRSVGLVYHQPVVHFHLGAALYGAGYVEAAIESLETAVQFQPDLGEAHGILARVLRSKGDLGRAAEHEAASAALRKPTPGP
ncbi:MAG TPA: hypothetical protein VML54_03700 [Candidatus Limnocylindrales bacterium]|nr:hypothetical protein [Candidatus Limnocylindrales bacterium]